MQANNTIKKSKGICTFAEKIINKRQFDVRKRINIIIFTPVQFIESYFFIYSKVYSQFV
jgi:hypothetical protein